MPYLEILNNLTELELPNTRLNNHDVGVIGIHAPKVKLLNLMDTRFSDNELKSLFLPLDPEGKYLHDLQITEIQGSENVCRRQDRFEIIRCTHCDICSYAEPDFKTLRND